jgi:hypothetical protein
MATAKTKGKKAAAEVEDTEETMLYDSAVSNSYLLLKDG